MATANTKLTVDTSQAHQSIKDLNAAWINATAGMQIVEKAFNLVAGAVEYVNQSLKDQAQFFSAVKDASQLASVQMAMAATDGMIKPMTLAKGANVLMRGDLKLTQDQMDAVAKAAVELGRATGEDVNQVFDRLSKGVLKGSAEAMLEYGIQVSNTGTIQQRQQRILEQLTSRYGGLTIAVGDAAEAMAAEENRAQLRMNIGMKSFDSWSQSYTRWKGEMKEGASLLVDVFTGSSFSGYTQDIKIARAMFDKMIESSEKYIESSDKLFSATLDKEHALLADEKERFALEAATLKSEIDIKNSMIKIAEKLGGSEEARQKKIREYQIEINKLEEERIANLAMAEQYEAAHSKTISERGKAIQEERIARKEKLEAAKQELRDVIDLEKYQKVSGRTSMSTFEINKKIAFIRSEIKDLEPKVTADIREQTKEVGLLKTAYQGVLDVWKMADNARRGLIGLGTETAEEKAQRLQREADEKKRKMEAARAAYEQSMEDTKKYLADAEKEAGKSLDSDIQSFGETLEKKKNLEKEYLQLKNEWSKAAKEAERANMNAAIEEEIAARILANAKQIKNDRDALTERRDHFRELAKGETGELKAEYKKREAVYQGYLDSLNEKDKARLESIKAKTIEVSGVVLGAIFAEKKAREGLSKSEYIMKQLAVYMKGQALRYAAEAIGHGAQALAASVLAPATAPALWAASAADAAAAAAFGLGAAAAGKMSGKPSGGSKSESSSKGPQRETLTGTSVQRSEITVILGGRGVVIGNADELARQIGTIMGDAQRRGVVRA